MSFAALLDADGTIFFASADVEAVLGWKPADLVGMNADDLISAEDLGQMAGSEAHRPMRLRMLRRDGVFLTVEVAGRPRTHADGSSTIIALVRTADAA